MNLFEQWLLFVGLMALGQFSPGPDMVLLTRTSLQFGRRAGWLMVLGIVTGLCLHAAIATAGISALLAQGSFWETVLSVAAACYLAWLGWQMIRSRIFKERVPDVEPSEQVGKGRWYRQGLFCNLLNPKVVIFFAGITALFLEKGQPVWWPFAMWVTIVLESLILWGLWVVVLQHGRVRRVYQKAASSLDVIFGCLLWGLAGLLVMRAF